MLAHAVHASLGHLEPSGNRQQAPALEPSAGPASWPAKPHIVLWLVDDQGWANVGYHNENVITPTMDFLAREGATLDRHYTAPWCAPSRSALMTGIMPHLGMQGIATALPKHVTLISEVMKEAGYTTHHIGKWHLGMTRLWQYPTSRGFDTSFGFMDGQADYVTQMCQEGNGGARSSWACRGVDLQSDGLPAIGRNGTFAMDWFKGHITFPIHNRTDPTKPLFLFVAMQAMHTPSPGPETLQALIDQYRAAGHDDARFIESNALITLADRVLEYTVAALQGAQMWPNTLLVHLSDNGGQVVPSAMDHLPQGSNWPLRGMKRSYFEGGVRVPAFVAGGALPVAARGKTVQGYIHIADWFATLSEVAGVPHEYEAASDVLQSGSISMAAFLEAGGEGTFPRTSMTLGAGDTGNTVNFIEAVIHKEWKLINGSQPCTWSMYQAPLFPNMTSHQTDRFTASTECLHKKTVFLFNIRDDPNETTNLADENPGMLRKLFNRLDQARAEFAAMPRLEVADKPDKCKPSAWSVYAAPSAPSSEPSSEPSPAHSSVPLSWAVSHPGFTTHGCGQFHNDHDRADSDKAAHCEAYTKANGGFLGPYMEGREVNNFEVEYTLAYIHPLAFKDPDVYTDD